MTAKRGGSILVVAAITLAVVSCQPAKPVGFIKSAKYGIFFGGQIEERRDVPFELDRTKQTQGFRVDFSEPLGADTPIEWRIDLPKTTSHTRKKPVHDPGKSPKGDDAPTTAAETPRLQTGSEVAHAGATRFEHETPFSPGDPLGLWNVRVVVRGLVVIDRPVEVYEAAAREKLIPKDGGF